MAGKTHNKVTGGVLAAIELSPSGIAPLDVLASISPASRGTLLATLCRLAREKRVVRLKRGVYSVAPIRDGYAAAQAKFGGYIAFSSALRLHGLISEEPFTITVATPVVSKAVRAGNLEFRAVALKERAVGSVKVGAHEVSSRAKTLFDCLYLPRYSVEKEKLAGAYSRAGMGKGEWREFGMYAKRFGGRKAKAMLEFGKRVRGAGNGNS